MFQGFLPLRLRVCSHPQIKHSTESPPKNSASFPSGTILTPLKPCAANIAASIVGPAATFTSSPISAARREICRAIFLHRTRKLFQPGQIAQHHVLRRIFHAWRKRLCAIQQCLMCHRLLRFRSLPQYNVVAQFRLQLRHSRSNSSAPARFIRATDFLQRRLSFEDSHSLFPQIRLGAHNCLSRKVRHEDAGKRHKQSSSGRKFKLFSTSGSPRPGRARL